MVKVLKTLKARDLWDKIMRSTYENSDPGFILIDQINRMNNNWFCENIRATNPCFSGDTLIATVDGRYAVPISQLASEGKDVLVYCYGDGKTRIRLGRNPRKTGTKQLYKVTLDDGSVVRVTDNHKWILSNFDTKTTLELSPNDSLLRFDRTLSSWYKIHSTDSYYYEVDGELEHRLIGREKLGRELLSYPDEIGHHIDENMYNNSWNNIEVMSQSEHNSKHWKDKSFVINNGNAKVETTISKHVDLMYEMIKISDRMPCEHEFFVRCYELGYTDADPSKSRYDFTTLRTAGGYKNLMLYFFFSDVFRSTSHYKDSNDVEVIDSLTGKKFTRKDPRWFWKTNKRLWSAPFRSTSNEEFETYDNYLKFNEKFEAGWDTCNSSRNQGIHYADKIRRIKAYANSKNVSLTLSNWDSNENWIRTELGGFIPSDIVKQVFNSTSDLELAGNIGNHSVVSIEIDTTEDVFNITVDQYHNLGIITSICNKDNKDTHSGIFMKNCGE